MHDILPTADDVVAIAITGKVTGADLDAAMDRLDRAFAATDAAGGKVHVFVETRGIEGIEVTSLPGYFARGMPLMTRLNRFGRVAVVADQAWIRFATRFESMVLPFISYRVFEPDRRDEALAWVTQGTD